MDIGGGGGDDSKGLSRAAPGEVSLGVKDVDKVCRLGHGQEAAIRREA